MLVDNDANLGALAESAYGAGRRREDLVYLMLSSGIGAGLMLRGRLYRGSRGVAGELGHVLVDPRGRRLPLRQPRLPGDRRAAALVELLRRSHGPLTVRRCSPGARRRPRLPARDRRRRPGRRRAAGRTCQLLNPDLVVVGGELPSRATCCSTACESVSALRAPGGARARAIVRASGERAEVLGALALAGRRGRVDAGLDFPHLSINEQEGSPFH